MHRRLLSASRGIAWVALGLSVASILVWFALPIVVSLQGWGASEGNPAVSLLYAILFGGGLVLNIQFVPLFAADVFLWFVARGKLQGWSRRRFWTLLWTAGGLISVGVVLWYARDAIRLFGGTFI